MGSPAFGASTVREAAERHGFAWACFDHDGPFALVRDDRSRAPDPAVLASLGLGGSACGKP
ncbi:MAG: hypothetical protein M5U07_28020 [Xanthobacteraceae bacterium]|nr:hypothetical protein [Xanthobacteraceae bacterium]PWB65565.1 MAG: hypothetical protein C3F17_03785 [Bradyrhizobiaceae bacterium]